MHKGFGMTGPSAAYEHRRGIDDHDIVPPPQTSLFGLFPDTVQSHFDGTLEPNHYTDSIYPEISRRFVDKCLRVLSIFCLILSVFCHMTFGLGFGIGWLWLWMSPKIWFKGGLILVGLLPTVWLRSRTLYVRRKVPCSRLSYVLSVFSKSNALVWSAHYWASMVMGTIYYWSSSRLSSRVFLYPEGNFSPPQLNENYIYIYGLINFVAVAYTAYRYFWERDQLAFPAVQRSWAHRVTVRDSCAHAARLAGYSTGAYALQYLFFGGLQYQTIKAFVQFFVKGGLMIHWRYRISVFSPALLLHTYLTAFFIIFALEVAHMIVEVTYTQPVEKAVSLRTVVEGLLLPAGSYGRFQAHLQLRNEVRKGAVVRKQIYGEKSKPYEALWKPISEALLADVERVTKALEDERKAINEKSSALLRPRSFVPSTSSVKRVSVMSPEKEAAGVQGYLMKLLYPPTSPTRRGSGLESSETKAYGTVTAGHSTSAPEVPLPELLRPRRVEKKVSFAEEKTVPENKVDKYANFYKNPGQKLLSSAITLFQRVKWGAWIVSTPVEYRTHEVFKDWQETRLAIEALTILVTHAPKEDNFAEVHRGLSLTLTTLIRLYLRLYEHVRNPPAIPTTAGNKAEQGQVVDREASCMLNVMKNALYRVVEAWYTEFVQGSDDQGLWKLEFDPDVARALQDFVDFQT
ncbi:hypothetical protein HDU85_002183 [Gaertneriomyces sp. JEL0708]|nr:hypothetical protein HDU85_002183 [Gaertneriomyces sp. JEL0708]